MRASTLLAWWVAVGIAIGVVIIGSDAGKTGNSCVPCPTGCSCPFGVNRTCEVMCKGVGLDRVPLAHELPTSGLLTNM